MTIIEGQRLHWEGEFTLSSDVTRWLIEAPAVCAPLLADAIARYLRADWGLAQEERKRTNDLSLLPGADYRETGHWGTYATDEADCFLLVGKSPFEEGPRVGLISRALEELRS